MSKQEIVHRFGPEQWVTMKGTGENVKIECWSTLANAYRVRSRKSGLQFATHEDLAEICVHPEVHLGRHWHRCQGTGCGAPLTPGLPECPRCNAPLCTCGRCQCTRATAKAAKATGVKTARKKRVPRAAVAV